MDAVARSEGNPLRSASDRGAKTQVCGGENSGSDSREDDTMRMRVSVNESRLGWRVATGYGK